MKIFLDANIIIDLITNRNKDSNDLKAFINSTPKETLYISALTIHIVFYVLKIKYTDQNYKAIAMLLNDFNIVAVDEIIINKALTFMKNDLEDAIQFFSASRSCDIVLTRDQKEFKRLKDLLNIEIKIITNPKL